MRDGRVAPCTEFVKSDGAHRVGREPEADRVGSVQLVVLPLDLLFLIFALELDLSTRIEDGDVEILEF